MNSLLLANLIENFEEALSLHSGVSKDILLGNLNCVFGFCNLYLNKRALITPTGSFKVNNKDSFTRDNSQDFPPVIILSSIIDKVSKVEEKLVRVKEVKLSLLQNDTSLYNQSLFILKT